MHLNERLVSLRNLLKSCNLQLMITFPLIPHLFLLSLKPKVPISQSSHCHHLWNSQLPIISARARYHALWASIFRAFGINFSCFWHHFRALKYFANCKTGQSGLINFASSATTFLYFGFYSSTIWAIFYSLPISHLASVVTCGHVEHRSRPIEDKVSLG